MKLFKTTLAVMTVASALSFTSAVQVNAATATSITTDAVSSYSETVVRYYQVGGSTIPDSIQHVDYRDGYRYQGTLYRVYTRFLSNGQIEVAYSGTMYMQ